LNTDTKKDYSPFEEQEPEGIYYEDVAPNTVVKNTNIYTNGNDFNINRNTVTRASTVYKASALT